MQIHEVTLTSFNEGQLLDKIKTYAGAAIKPGSWISSNKLSQNLEQSRLRVQSQNYVNWLMDQWKKESPELLRQAYHAKNGPPINEDAQDDAIYRDVFSRWVRSKLRSHKGKHVASLDRALQYDPILKRTLEQQLSGIGPKSGKEIREYISTALSGLQSYVRDQKDKHDREHEDKLYGKDEVKTEPSVQQPSDSRLNPDVKVISWHPNLIIRYKNQDFLMDEEEYGNRRWFIMPSGNPVKKKPIVRFLNYQADIILDDEDTEESSVEEVTVTVKQTGTRYSRAADGSWTDEFGQKISTPESIAYLNNLAKSK